MAARPHTSLTAHCWPTQPGAGPSGFPCPSPSSHTALSEKQDCRALLPGSHGHVFPAASGKRPKLLASAWALLHLAGTCPDGFHLSSVPCSLPLSPACSPTPGLHFCCFLYQESFLLPLGSGVPAVGATVGHALCWVCSGQRDRPSPCPRELGRRAIFLFHFFFWLCWIEARRLL